MQHLLEAEVQLAEAVLDSLESDLVEDERGRPTVEPDRFPQLGRVVLRQQPADRSHLEGVVLVAQDVPVLELVEVERQNGCTTHLVEQLDDALGDRLGVRHESVVECTQFVLDVHDRSLADAGQRRQLGRLDQQQVADLVDAVLVQTLDELGVVGEQDVEVGQVSDRDRNGLDARTGVLGDHGGDVLVGGDVLHQLLVHAGTGHCLAECNVRHDCVLVNQCTSLRSGWTVNHGNEKQRYYIIITLFSK